MAPYTFSFTAEKALHTGQSLPQRVQMVLINASLVFAAWPEIQVQNVLGHQKLEVLDPAKTGQHTEVLCRDSPAEQ